MIDLITAIGNPYINEKIKKIKKYNVILRDIQYQDGILEILNINQSIKILLVSTRVLEKINFIEKLQEKFQNLEIIIFIDKKIESDITYLNSRGIYKIYLNNEIGYEECLKNLSYIKANIEEQVKTEMKELKKEILEKQNKKFKKISNKKNNLLMKNHLIPKVIMFSGARGVRKKYCFIYFF